MKKDKRGFTLVELIAVIVILIILMIIAVTMANKHMERTQINVFLKEANTFARGAMQKETVDRDDGLYKDDIFHNRNYGKVCYSINQKILGSYVSKTKSNYRGSVEVCYGLDCTYATKIWITDGKHFVDGKTDPSDESFISSEFSSQYPYSCGVKAIGGGNDKGDYLVANYDYTGKEEIFDVILDGVYALEVWGAQGGDYSPDHVGGYGAYAYAEIDLHRGEQLFINVGGKGPGRCLAGETCYGGYNGGGKNSNQVSGGGGATHIAGKSGLLYDVPISYVYAIAGGGAGNNGNAGEFFVRHAGGYTTTITNYGGNCTGELRGKFGSYGGFRPTATDCFGRGSGYSTNTCYSGQIGIHMIGGTSYVFNPRTKNGVMYCYNCPQAYWDYGNYDIPFSTTRTITLGEYSEDPISHYSKTGNGYARITYIENFTS